MKGIRLYLLDVEGTTSPVSLVYEKLFPYVKAHLRAFLRLKAAEPEVVEVLRLLGEESLMDKSAPRLVSGELDATTTYIDWLMVRDRKSTALKRLQGMVWRAGYEAGELQGEVFEDVPRAFARWSERAKVAIYSSGSTEAQRLLFGHSNYGDLTPYLSAYFDTRVGPKTERASYERIAAEMGVAVGGALFISDVPRELDPAREAGFQTRLSLRPGNTPVENMHDHIATRTFEEIE